MCFSICISGFRIRHAWPRADGENLAPSAVQVPQVQEFHHRQQFKQARIASTDRNFRRIHGHSEVEHGRLGSKLRMSCSLNWYMGGHFDPPHSWTKHELYFVFWLGFLCLGHSISFVMAGRKGSQDFTNSLRFPLGLQ